MHYKGKENNQVLYEGPPINLSRFGELLNHLMVAARVSHINSEDKMIKIIRRVTCTPIYVPGGKKGAKKKNRAESLIPPASQTDIFAASTTLPTHSEQSDQHELAPSSFSESFSLQSKVGFKCFLCSGDHELENVNSSKLSQVRIC